jgi:hypothetical protein
MAILVSPGVDIQIIDESLNSTGGPTTTPLIVIATRENKVLTDQNNVNLIAPGTTKENANQLFFITSQAELVQTFGNPVFEVEQGTVKQGSELNEYGLLAAYSLLGLSNRAFIIRADVDLNQLVATREEPTNPALTGTYWLDLNETVWGLFKSNGNTDITKAWEANSPLVIANDSDLERVIISDVGYSANSTFVGISGNLSINGVTIAVSATNTLQDVSDAINNANIQNINSVILRLKSLSWLVVKNTANKDINISGTGALLTILGLNNPVDVIQPKYTFGSTGNTAVVAAVPDNLIFEKILPTDKNGEADPDAIPFWFLIGSLRWKNATPTYVTGVNNIIYSANPVPVGDGFTITDGVDTVTVVFSTLSSVATLNDVRDTIYSEIVSANLTNKFNVIINSNSNIVISNINGEDLLFTNLSANNTNVLSLLGISSKKGNRLFYSPHYNIPANSVNGDFWIKTTSPNKGASYAVKRYSRTSGIWSKISVPFYLNDDNASYNLGTNIPINTLYIRYNLYGTFTNPIASHLIKRYTGNNEVSIIATETPGVSTPALVPGDKFVIIAGQPNGTQVSYVVTVTGPDSDSLVLDINNLGIPNVSAEIFNDFVKITNDSNFSLQIGYYDPVSETYVDSSNTGDPLASLGITDGTYVSNWEDLEYVAQYSEPRTEAEEGRLWFNDNLRVDIMVNNGTQWKGYRNYYNNTDPNGVILGATPPETQSDGTPLVDNDLWIDTSDLKNYPKIYRWRSSLNDWELIDNTDQTTPLGILFADARPNNNGQKNGLTSPQAMVISDYVDPDCPDPQVYPVGMLLFNTRYSTYNVKKWLPNYFKDLVGKEESPGVQYSVGSSVFPTNTIIKENQGRWVTESGNKLDGSPYMGRFAQRAIVVRRMQETLITNQDIRSEFTFFNIIACPGYPELIDEMVVLNTDKKEVAFIIGDTPARLDPSSTSLLNWAKNRNNAPTNGEDGLVTNNPYVGIYYPWGLTTNTDGLEVAVPPSHIVLRNIAYSDAISFPWFAPAGYTRGLVTNAVSVGYITEENEFKPIILNQAQRDILYENKINPIAYIQNRGLVIFGQKTTHPVAESAMSRINVIRLINYLKYNFDLLAKPFLFEPNDKQTRDQVTSVFERFLGNLVSLRGLYDFAVLCNETNNTNERIDRNELWIDIAIQPTKTIEFIYIPIRIKNTGEDLTNFLPT